MKTLKVQKGKLLFTAMVLCAVLFIWNQAGLKAQAYIQTQGTVTAESANIREKADTTSTAIASVKKGDKLTINNEVTGTDGKVWYYVYVDNSTMGYISAELVDKKDGNSNNTQDTTPDTTPSITPDDEPDEMFPDAQPVPIEQDGVTPVQNVSATVTGSTVNVRKDADGSASILSKVQKEMVVTITGQKDASDGKTWYRVFFTSNGTETKGFIRSDFLKPDGEIVPITEETKEPNQPSEEEPGEPAVQPKDYETIYKENAEGTPSWYLINQVTGEESEIAGLLQAKKDNETLQLKMKKEQKSQKTTVVILVLILLLFAAGFVLLFIKCKDAILAEFFGEKRPAPARNRRPDSGRNGQRRPQGSTRPQGGSRPQGGARPQGGSRPQGSARPQNASRPQGGARPQGSVRPQSAGRPQGSVRPQSAGRPQPGARPQPGVNPKEIVKPQPTLEKSIPKDTQQKWKSKNFMNDDDEFEFEFLNWDGQEDK